MKSTHSVILVVLLFVFTASCSNEDSPTSPSNTPQADAKPNPAESKIPWRCAAGAPSFDGLGSDSTMPVPTETLLSDQQTLNCFAWQEFIALNWDVAGGSAKTFGDPASPATDPGNVVFETYGNVHTLMRPDAAEPPLWGSWLGEDGRKRDRALHRTSKVRADFDLGDLDEAAPFGRPRWLADKDANLVWYEVLVNEDEYDYIRSNKFYDATEQERKAKNGTPVDLPKGVLGGQTGAIELKAAWLRVEDPSDSRWQRYKLTEAEFCSKPDDCTTGIVALVGLHIIHKTTSQPSWIWATFEHVDNAPDRADVASGSDLAGFTFFDEACTPKPVSPACIQEQRAVLIEELEATSATNAREIARIQSKIESIPTQTSCEPNTSPLYELDMQGGKPDGACQPYPVQVVRDYPLPSTNENPIVQTNQSAHELIRRSNPDSVYQYYQLVNVIWNDSPVDELARPVVPTGHLSNTGFRPNLNAFPVSNTVLETYVQGTACIQCHAFATIAGSSVSPAPVADYSFVIGMAKAAKETDAEPADTTK